MPEEEDKLQQATESMDRLLKQMETLSGELLSAKQRVQIIESEKTQLNQKLVKTHEQIETLEEQLNEAKATARTLTDDNRDLRTKQRSLQTQISDLRTTIKTITNDGGVLGCQIEEAKIMLEVLAECVGEIAPALVVPASTTDEADKSEAQIIGHGLFVSSKSEHADTHRRQFQEFTHKFPYICWRLVLMLNDQTRTFPDLSNMIVVAILTQDLNHSDTCSIKEKAKIAGVSHIVETSLSGLIQAVKNLNLSVAKSIV